MGRKAEIERKIRGKLVSSTDFKREIVALAHRMGEISADDVLRDFEIEMTEVNRRIVQRDLGYLAETIDHAAQDAENAQAKKQGRKRHKLRHRMASLKKSAHGLYRAAHAPSARRDVSNEALLQREIWNALVTEGGLARERDVLEALDARPKDTQSPDTRTYQDVRFTPEYQAIRRLLKRPPFNRPFGAYYALPDDALSKLVLEPKRAHDLLECGLIARNHMTNRNEAAKRKVEGAFYESIWDIGETVGKLLDDMGLFPTDLLKDPACAKAMTQWVYHAERRAQKLCYNRNLANWDPDRFLLVDNAGALNNARKYCEANFPGDPQRADDRLALLQHFRDGYRSAYETMPGTFFTALGALTATDPIFLSRGHIRLVTTYALEGRGLFGKYEEIAREAETVEAGEGEIDTLEQA